MAFFGFGGKNKNKNKDKNNENDTVTSPESKQDNTEDQDTKETTEDMAWFDDIIEGSNSTKSNKQILSKIYEQLTGENMVSRLRSPQQRQAAKIWGKLAHRCDISYPSPKLLETIDCNDEKNSELLSDIRYSVRHAIAAYPPTFIVFLGLKNDVAFAFKSTKKLVSAAFNIEPKDIVIDNCSNNLIIPNATHQPSFYLCVDHNESKIVLSIRGSSSIADALTDVNAVAKPYSAHGINGWVHEGIMAATKFVFDKVTQTLVKLCNEYKDYSIIISGHSLGAGIASCLGLLYWDHPIIHKQNKLHVYSFASPCVVSVEFVEKGIADDFITSIALSTDLVTRLSLESVKQGNLRLDAINSYDKKVIKECMLNLKDDNQELVQILRSLPTPNPTEQLFPLGRILWFVPKIAMDQDDVNRRKCLMGLKDPNDNPANNNDNDEEGKGENEETTEIEVKKKKKRDYATESTKGQSLSKIFATTWNNLNKGFEEFQETMDNSILNAGGAKYSKKYDGSNYVLCDASKCRSTFQDLVLDLPESLYSHMPNRYLWACDAHLSRGKLQD